MAEIPPILNPPVPATQKEFQSGLVSEGQRKVNLIWEFTQASIAISVVVANLVVGVHVGLYGKPGDEVPAMLTNSLFLVIGFYFSRTNHTNIGGVGPHPDAALPQRRGE